LTDLRRDGELSVRLEVETDEQWSYVGAKSNQRWCCAGIPKGTSAVDHATNAEIQGGSEPESGAARILVASSPIDTGVLSSMLFAKGKCNRSMPRA